MINKKWLFVLMIFVFPLVLGGVMINEIESNPQSSDPGKEWVEVYNNESVVNLSGWYLTDRNDNKFYFPDVMMSSLYVLDNLNGFVNSNENISLFDDFDLLKDRVELISDGSNDNKTHQRVPDGTGGFVFKEMTKGLSNSGCVFPTDGMIITENITFCEGEYYLPNGISLVNNIELNCNGSKLVGNGNISFFGVKLYDNTIVRNCEVSNYSSGFFVSGENNSLINNAAKNSLYGFQVFNDCPYAGGRFSFVAFEKKNKLGVVSFNQQYLSAEIISYIIDSLK